MRGKKQTITLSDDARKAAVASIRRYFADELEQEIGELKAMLVLEYMLAELGPTIYNQAMGDARQFLMERVEDLGAIHAQNEFPYWVPTKR